MEATLRKWRAVFGIYFQDGLAYRASGIIWILTDLVTAVTMPFVWASAARSGYIKGFSTGDFVLYYLCILIVGSFVTSHIMWELAMEIREGQFTTALVRPMSFYQVSFFRNLSWRVLRTALTVPIMVGLFFLYQGYLGDARIHVPWTFWISLILGHGVSFVFVMLMASFALYVTEATSIFELYYIPMIFLSGQILPVDVLPTWARNLSKLFPFYYTTAAPTEIMIGRLAGEASFRVLGIQLAWVVACYAVSKILWSRGMRHYTAVGM
ncbi:MAG TPA: ABC-2 family transporter protein [Fimbriimonas sp.]